MEYQKPALTFEQQLDLLINRGLIINDRAKSIRYFQNISYYRLSAYCQPFKQDENFAPETNIEDVIELYIFDQKLRSLVMEAVDPIEVALRTQIIYHLSHKYDVLN
jgi:abortive infection bacteriophage resistance protein